MTKLKDSIRQALSETPLGSGLLVDETALDASAEQLIQFARDIRAHAIMSVAWQLPSKVATPSAREELKCHLLKVSDSVRQGTHWEE